jgi:hypothetical protein
MEPTETPETSQISAMHEQSDQHLDGNAAGGVLGMLFPFEMTLAVATCVGCGASNPLATVAAYIHGMGTVLRCPQCDLALIRVVHARDRYYLDLRGVRVLQLTESTTFA